jgi:hypothetical protein
MTIDELTSWHAERTGAYFSVDLQQGPIGWCDKDGRLLGDNPFPPTLDGADGSFPPGWDWWRMIPIRDGEKTLWATINIDRPVDARTLEDTGDKARDLYELSKLAWEAQ